MPSNYLSHIEKDSNGAVIYSKKLKDHANEVTALAIHSFQQLPVSGDRKKLLEDCLKLIGLVHDFGKYTSYFQDYLVNGIDKGQLKNHSLISAVWGVWSIYKNEQLTDENKYYSALLVFGVILNHHGEIQNFSEWLRDLIMYYNLDLRDYIESNHHQSLTTLFTKQIPDLINNCHSIDEEMKNEFWKFPPVSAFAQVVTAASESGFVSLLEEAFSLYEKFINEKKCNQFHSDYYLLFSLLIDSDKKDAAQINYKHERKYIDPEIVNKYLTSFISIKPDDPLNVIRKSIHDNLQDRVTQLDKNQRIYTITAPTGSGKTLSVLNFALKLRDRITKEDKYIPRIIYSLPFTTIIEQNFDVFYKVLKQIPDFELDESAYLLKHHYLADINYQQSHNDSIPVDKALMLVESWESEIIVTTFIQLFTTIIGDKNRSLKKFYKLYGSIIILDEIQNIPIEYWKLFENSLQTLAVSANCYLILMTATQPLIFPPANTIELLTDSKFYFNQLARTKLNIDLTPRTIEEFYHYFKDTYRKTKSCAIIVNTISSSLQFFELLQNDDSINCPLYYLSTNIIPNSRNKCIEEIHKLLKNNKPVILVSTQVIEAGVDLDFNIIFRDIAPVDSIIQAAGRANRNGKNTTGLVYIVKIVNDNNRPAASWIYGAGHLNISEKLLNSNKTLDEKEFYDLVNTNYKNLVQISDLHYGMEIFNKWWLESNFSYLENFQLIKNHGYNFDIFIPIDELGVKIWHEYIQKVYKERDSFKRKKNYLVLKKQIYGYTVTISEKFVKSTFWDYCNGNKNLLGCIDPDFLSDFYDKQTGFIRPNDNKVMIF